MAFRVPPKTLARLEWPDLVARLAEHLRTPRGRERLASDASPFEAETAGMRERLAETSEARAVLDAGDAPPLGGARPLAATLARLGKGGNLSPAELRDVGATLATFRLTERFLASRTESAPRLADRAAGLAATSDLEDEIERCIDAEGEVADAASPLLAEARRESHRLAAEIQQRIGRYLQDPDVAPALSDSFYTVRGDRYVLPVRADSRGRVPGIVHDASASGTTLFVEPQALVELNNRHKQAELAVERETQRVLRALTEAAARERDPIEAGLEALADLDLAFARGALSGEQEAVEPEVGEEGVFRLVQLRHPLLPREQVVPNDVRLGESFHVLVISGPNAGGKTVAMKALALAVLGARAGLHVPADPGARLDAVETLLADIGDEQDLRESLSTFSAHVANLAEIVREAGPRSLVALDEVGVGTDPSEGAALAQATLESLADAGARVVATTHYNLLKEMADVDPRFENASVEFDPETLEPTYRLRLGAAGSSSATAVAARMGMPSRVLERASALLEREDRQLDRVLTELATSRAALERERREAGELRAESESARDAYRHKLERLQERRDELFAAMRGELDHAFREAHAEVAGVIRELQRKGTARDAAEARERLLALEARAREAQQDAAPEARAAARPVDWRRARAGDPVEVPGGRRGVLVALPDRRGRATVQVGAAKLSLPADRLSAAAGGPARPPASRVRVDAPRPVDAASRCDLRGLRVAEALERLAGVLDAAAAAGLPEVAIVHGIGGGALLRAVREHLSESPYVVRFEAGDPERGEPGGAGVTVARLSE